MLEVTVNPNLCLTFLDFFSSSLKDTFRRRRESLTPLQLILAHLEHMECFKLNVGAFISQQVHHQLQVFWFADVFRHDGKVVSVQNQFTQKL